MKLASTQPPSLSHISAPLLPGAIPARTPIPPPLMLTRTAASRPLSRAQAFALASSLLVIPLVFWQHWLYGFLFAFVASSTLLYFAILGLKSHLAVLSATGATLSVSDAEVKIAAQSKLPPFTLLVPLYHEGALVPALITSLAKLRYPVESLQVLLLLEADDQDTHMALAQVGLPLQFTVLDIAPEALRTKPKACNAGLLHARGAFIGVYDAEDAPDADQLLKVVAGFLKSDPGVACLQAKLAFTNHSQNFLTRFFAAEYATYFNLLLPGLDRLGLPTPLGGTSNFFRTQTLRALGGWDPYNVTEDLDLGMVLARSRLRILTLDSTTHEVATWLVSRWLRQRTRWIKGYIQTWFVHMRNPVQLCKDLGPLGFFGFLLLVGGTPLVLLLNPLFWGLTLIYAFTGSSLVASLYPTPLYWVGLFSMVVGNFIFIWLAMAGCMRQGLHSSVKWMALLPLYWLLMSVAAWWAAWQFFRRPHYWDKTDHAGHSFSPATSPVSFEVQS